MSELTGIKFRPVMGKEETILSRSDKNNGWLYVATDTGKMFLDVNNQRVPIGGEGGSGGSGFAWADGADDTIRKVQPDNDDDSTYYIDLSIIKDGIVPKVDNLILNSDGRFFRVLEIDLEEGVLIASLIAVSGGGSGGGGGTGERDVSVAIDSSTIQKGGVYIYGQEYYAIFTPSNTAKDDYCDLKFTIIENGQEIDTIYANDIPNNTPYQFNMGQLPLSDSLSLKVTVSSLNSQWKNGAGYSPAPITDIKVVSLDIQKDPELKYIPLVQPGTTFRSVNVSYVPQANRALTVQQHVYIDGIEDDSLQTVVDSSQYGKSVTVSIPGQTHGVHKIEISLSTVVNRKEIATKKIEYQAAWAEAGENTPIIWLGNYDTVIENYTTSYIEFMVYDPIAASQSMPAEIYLYKNGSEVGQMSFPYSSSDFEKWDISTIYEVGENIFGISCRSTRINIEVEVITGTKNLDIRSESLILNYSSAGRSNSEVSSRREIYKDLKSNVQATLQNFNWKNNGWNNDGMVNGIDNGSYLTLANGAKVTIPFSRYTLNNGINGFTVEMRFRIKNVQKYSTLVKSFAKYFIVDENTGDKSSQSYTMAEIEEMSEILGHDVELYYDEYGSPLMDEKVQKEWEKEEGVVCKWLSGDNGIAIGTQEAYFASPEDIVSVRYKEDEVINISIVISGQEKLSYIYLNGILSGAAKLPDRSFNIDSNFVINSDYCDIDLYRFRIYDRALTMPDIIHNYLSDIHSVKLYDQNQLTGVKSTQLSYEELIRYNEEHPDEPTMPYVVWKMLDDNKGQDGVWTEQLPFIKQSDHPCEVTFVNPSLDRALEKGLIDDWYYYTHCPSYHAIGVGINVQGTSSQGYPRRNFKTKFKSAVPSDKNPDYIWEYTNPHGSLYGLRVDENHTVLQTKNSNGEDLATPVEKTLKKKYHMDNESIGTNKFTWKIDYMESSGTYNTGYANLMGNQQHPLYTQHPLDFYNISGVNTDGLRTTVYGFPVLAFHEYSNMEMNPSASGQYEYVGRYNFNLDKSSNEYYGFELEKEQPYIDLEWDEMAERDVIDPNTGEPMTDEDGKVITEKYVKAHHSHPWISQIAECWELADNQGTWCSWKFPNETARRLGFRTPQSGYADRYEMIRHFEYRYSYYGDQLDAIGPEGDYNGDPDKRTKFRNEIGTTDLEYSNYAYKRYKNLEAVFKWLDSTNQENATNERLSGGSLTINTPRPYDGIGETSVPYTNYIQATRYDSSETYYIETGDSEHPYQEIAHDDYQYWDTTTTDIVDEDNNVIATSTVVNGFKSGITYYINTILYYVTTFENDSAGYRLEKFRTEFENHLNKEYCLVYYIMTELLLCYDSRGKNMMFASFGPKEAPNYQVISNVTENDYDLYYIKDGDNYIKPSEYDSNATYYENTTPYIWFPIFYDIDTQLGLNNSGAYLWDYDANVSEEGLFSTPTSVLWVNLWDAFKEDIKATYRLLRGSNSSSVVNGSLTYNNIAGAYTCDSTVFDSYAMKGLRPIIAIGLDEYYKYFATTTASGVGYFNTKGELIKESSPTYAYACQGDKILTTELLLRNRLNYIDSWWMGGDYDITAVKGGELQLRVSGNRATLTSDKYLDTSATTIPEGIITAQYPVDYYDAKPGYKLKPFLKQYVSYFTDEVPGEPIRYTGEEGQEDGVWTLVPDSTLSAYQVTPETPNEQLNYIPGLDYLSSLGDLSTSYISEFSLRKGKRLLDLILGSDAPNYFNDMISENTIFNLAMADNDTGKKPLMKKIVLTGLRNLTKALDISGSPKLQEFRALNTNIKNVKFADGAPLHTVHLPKSVNDITLIQNNELKKILTQEPVVWNAESDTYKGLYVEGITDISASSTGRHTVNHLEIDGGGLGYDSYKLLEKFVLAKSTANNRTNPPTESERSRIGMLNQQWTPYELVENGEPYDQNIRYYKLNDHNMFDEWTFNATDWDKETLNGTLYTINSEKWDQKDTITDLSLFDMFLEAYENASRAQTASRWETKDGSNSASVPTITGTVYVDNDAQNLIDEAELTTIYGQKWPNLTITAAHVKTSNITKYVRVYDNGREETLQILRTSTNAPDVYTGVTPTQTHYDFLGWSLIPTYNSFDSETTNKLVLFYDKVQDTYLPANGWNELQFTEEDKTITLYAIFIPHEYQVRIYISDRIDPNDYTTYTDQGVTFFSKINFPSQFPYKEYTGEDLTMTWKFLGFSLTQGGSIRDLDSITVEQDMTLYPVFSSQPVSVYENPIGLEHLLFSEPYTYQGIYGSDSIKGYAVSFQGGYYSGKITIPAYGPPDETGTPLPIIAIAPGSSEFGASGESSNNIAYGGYAYHGNKITHIFFENHGNVKTQIREFKQYCFKDCDTLEYIEFPDTLEIIGIQAFAYTPIANLAEGKGINVLKIDNQAFIEKGPINEIHSSAESLIIGPNVQFIGENAFGLKRNLLHIQIGLPNEPSQLANITDMDNSVVWSKAGSGSSLSDITVYTDDETKAIWTEHASFRPGGALFNATVNIVQI